MLLKILKSFIPSIFFIIGAKINEKFDNPNVLFLGDDHLFKDSVSGIGCYGEYGCGKSTKWILNNTSAKVISVDTSSEWVEEVKSDNKDNNQRLNIHYVNLGSIGNWGLPIDYSRKENFSTYTDYIWQQKEKPKLVLIDGRFRVCCFLSTLKYAEEGTKIIFDDYVDRPHYHFVEKYLPRNNEDGRQCLFIVPDKSKIDVDELEKDINFFRFVMD